MALFYIDATFFCTLGSLEYLRYWNGYWDQNTEGTFVNVNNGQPTAASGYENWYVGEPNGLSDENCAVTWPMRNAWNDEGCAESNCGFCQLNFTPDFSLRGIFIVMIPFYNYQCIFAFI